MFLSVLSVRRTSQSNVGRLTNYFFHSDAPFATLLSQPLEKTNITSSVVAAGAVDQCNPTNSTVAVNQIILASIQDLKSNLSIHAFTALDDFETPLDFIQLNVNTSLDTSVLYATSISLLSFGAWF